MKMLDMSFKTSTHKIHHMKLRYASDGLTKEVVAAAMADMAAAKLFDKDGVNLLATPVAAKYVETVETPIIEAPKA